MLFFLLVSSSLLSGIEESKQIRLRFRTLSLGEPIEKVAYLNDGKKIRFTIPSDFLSPAQDYRGTSTLVFFQDITKTDRQDTRTQLRQELAAATEEARRQEAILHDANQEAAEAVAEANEGQEGDSARRQAALILALAAPAAEAAMKARERVLQLQTQIDSLPSGTEDSKLVSGKQTKRIEHSKENLTKFGTVTATEGESLILLFIPEGKAGRILKIQDPDQSHPYGTLRFLNIGSVPLRLSSPNSSQTAAPRQPTLFTPDSDIYGYVGIEIREAQKPGRVLRTLRARPEPAARTTYLIIPDTDGVNVKGITERAPPTGR